MEGKINFKMKEQFKKIQKREEDFLLDILCDFFMPELSKEITSYLRWDGWIEINRINTGCFHTSRRSDRIVTSSGDSNVEIRNPDFEVIKEFTFNGCIRKVELSDNGSYMMCISDINRNKMSIVSVTNVDTSEILFSRKVTNRVEDVIINHHFNRLDAFDERDNYEGFYLKDGLAKEWTEFNPMECDRCPDFRMLFESKGGNRFVKTNGPDPSCAYWRAIRLNDDHTLLAQKWAYDDDNDEHSYDIVCLKPTSFDVLF